MATTPTEEITLPPPPQMTIVGSSLAQDWKLWKQRFNLYMTATNKESKPEAQKVATLLHVIGPECLELFNTLGVEMTANTTLKQVIDAFDTYFIPKVNIPYERQKLFMIRQKEAQTIDEFVTELRQQITTCDYKEQSESVLMDQLIRGLRNDDLRERLLRVTDLNINKALDVCRASESAHAQLKVYSSASQSINIIRKNNVSRTKANEKWPKSNIVGKNNVKSTDRVYSCNKCGRTHEYRKCPAFGKECRKCKKLNHFGIVCRTRINKNRVQLVEVNEQLEEQSFVVEMVTKEKEFRNNEWATNLEILGTKVKFKIDTGSEINVITKSELEKVPISKLNVKPYTKKIVSYTGNQITGILGECELPCKSDSNSTNSMLKFVIVDGNYTPILGLKDSAYKLNLVKRVKQVATQENCGKNKEDTKKFIAKPDTDEIIKEFDDVFKGIGKVPGKHKIRLKNNAEPVITAARKVPFAIQGKLKQELDHMEKEGIIEKITEPTEWVNPLVIVHKKNGALRICLDPKNLNKSIKREHYNIPTFDDIVHKMRGAKLFSVLDATSAFWQLQLDSDSSKLCTFATIFGRYKFLRIPYGISSAPEIFQRVTEEIIKGIDGAENFFDDIVVWGSTKKEHDNRLRQVLERCRENNLKLQREKSQIGVNKIKFLGHTLSEEGIEISNSKKQAINSIKVPETRKELQRFLGMVNFVSKFIPHISEKAKELRHLLHKNTPWVWTENHTKMMEEIKNVIINAAQLTYYNPKKPIEIEVDASSYGIGAVLLQENKPISFASCTLSNTQQNYAQIERELLAIVYGCKQFHQYIYGNKNVTIYTDHKPLIAMAEKPLSGLSARIQRLYLSLQKYDVKIKYKPGKEMFMSDALSRAPIETEHFETPDENIVVMEVQVNKRITDKKLLEIQKETKTDPVLQEVIKTLKERRSPKQLKTPESRKYMAIWNELKLEGELLLKSAQVVIPKILRSNILRQLHEGHFGVVTTINLARSCMYWPGMVKDIKNIVNNCYVCAKYQKANSPQPELKYEIPHKPWERLAADFLQFGQAKYLQVIDYFTKYIELVKLKNLTYNEVVPAIKSIFARHGVPEQLITDGGPPFNSYRFAEFAKKWNFTHLKVSANYPKSNGQVERSIQTIKQIIRKTLESNQDKELALLHWRSTPLKGLKYSPAELLMGRKLKTNLPEWRENKKTKINLEKFQKLLCEKKLRQEEKSKNRRYLRPLEPKQPVLVQTKVREWEPAVIQNRNKIPRSYKIKTNRGTIITRNRIHLKPTTPSVVKQFRSPETSDDEKTARIDVKATTDSPSKKLQQPKAPARVNFKTTTDSPSKEVPSDSRAIMDSPLSEVPQSKDNVYT